MNLQVNGKNYQSDTDLTLGQLFKQLDLSPERVVIELNQKILQTTDNLDTELREGDQLEIIQFVGGG